MGANETPRQRKRLGLGVLIVAAALLCAACSANLSKKHQFDSTSDKAIVVIGLEGLKRLGHDFQLHFAAQDRVSGAISPVQTFSVGTGKGLRPMEKEEYFVVEVEAGDYAIREAHFSAMTMGEVISFCTNSMVFPVRSGQVIYLGNYLVDQDTGGIARGSDRLDMARAVLDGYPNIYGAVQPVQGVPTHFDCPRGGL